MKLSRWYKKYRIVSDSYAGYEVQCWRIWFPFWIQVGFVNTHASVEQATKWINKKNYKEEI